MSIRRTSFFAHHSISLAATSTLELPISGAFFFCTESSAQFELSWGAGEWIPMEAGLGFRLQAPDEFTRLCFNNRGNEAITIQFYAGVGELIDGRITTIQDRVVQVYQKVFPTRVVGHGSSDGGTGVKVTAAAPYTIAAAARAQTGETRKQVIINNLDTTYNCAIYDADDNFMGYVQEKAHWTIDTTDDLIVKVGAAGNTVRVGITEIYYQRL